MRNTRCVCVCVHMCVCEREREGGGGGVNVRKYVCRWIGERISWWVFVHMCVWTEGGGVCMFCVKTILR